MSFIVVRGVRTPAERRSGTTYPATHAPVRRRTPRPARRRVVDRPHFAEPPATLPSSDVIEGAIGQNNPAVNTGRADD